jgi:penicillin-binding protein 1A
MRQQYVLRRMLELGFISEAEHRQAIDTPLKVVTSGTDFGGSADYVAEMARQIAYEQFQEEAYTRGIKVITTITKAEQEAAYRALRRGIMDYDRRHGYRGAEAYVDPARMKAEGEAMDEILAETPDYDDMLAAIVTEVRRRGHRLPLRRDDPHQRRRPALCRPHGGRQGPPNKRIRAGAIVRITRNDNGRWEITQLPEVEGALASADPRTGAIRALAGGFDFSATSSTTSPRRGASRAPASSPSSTRRPSKGLRPQQRGGRLAAVLLVRRDRQPGLGAQELRRPLRRPDLAAHGPGPLQEHGVDPPAQVGRPALRPGLRHQVRLRCRTPPGLPDDGPRRRLGDPWQMMRGYAVFANGGYRIEPYLVQEIRDDAGNVLARVDPPVAGETAERAIDERNAYLMDSIMKDVVRRGTATKAMVLKRGDLAGKTGTTNEYLDAWFCGYQPTLVTVAWIGFDQPRKLGSGETGGHAALPMWINYMRKALDGVPETFPKAPEGLIRVQPAGATEEMIYKENLPGAPPKHRRSPPARRPRAPRPRAGPVSPSG